MYTISIDTYIDNKGQVVTIFHHFEAMILRQFNAHIKKFQTDCGTKLKNLESHLFQGGYVRRITYPHTPSQNGVIERKNCHVVKIGLEMLMKSGVHIVY